MTELARFWDDEVLCGDLGPLHPSGAPNSHSLFETDLFAVGESLEPLAQDCQSQDDLCNDQIQCGDTIQLSDHTQTQFQHQLTRASPTRSRQHPYSLDRHNPNLLLSSPIHLGSLPQASTPPHLMMDEERKDDIGHSTECTTPVRKPATDYFPKRERPWRSFMDDNCPLRRRVKVTITPSKKRTRAQTVCGKRVHAVDTADAFSCLGSSDSEQDPPSPNMTSVPSHHIPHAVVRQQPAKKARKSAMQMQSTLCFTPTLGDNFQRRFHVDIRRGAPEKDDKLDKSKLRSLEPNLSSKLRSAALSKKGSIVVGGSVHLGNKETSIHDTGRISDLRNCQKPLSTPSQPLLSYVVPPIEGHALAPSMAGKEEFLDENDTDSIQLTNTEVSDQNHCPMDIAARHPLHSSATQCIQQYANIVQKEITPMQSASPSSESQRTSSAKRRVMVLAAIESAAASAKAAAAAATARSCKAHARKSSSLKNPSESSRNVATVAKRRCGSSFAQDLVEAQAFAVTSSASLRARIAELSVELKNDDFLARQPSSLSAMLAIGQKSPAKSMPVTDALESSLPCAEIAVAAVTAAARSYNSRLTRLCYRSGWGASHGCTGRERSSCTMTAGNAATDNAQASRPWQDAIDDGDVQMVEDFEYVERECALQLYLADC